MTQDVQAPTIPAHLGTRSRGGFNLKYLVGGGLLLLFVSFLIFQMVQTTRTDGAYFMTVAELRSAGPELIGQRVRVNGNVVAGSEDWNAQEITLKFAIVDEGDVSSASLPIVYYGPRPDNFQRAASAIVEGQLRPDGLFEAQTLLLKCPSRYAEEPEQVLCDENGCRTIQ
jgi:cytochrome c-type biogenesis protein CcmE